MASQAWLRPFSPGFRRAIGEQLDRPGERRVACFDADGTLWTEDIGESFLRWLLAGPLEPLVRREPGLYARYEARVRRSLTDGYGWAVQLMSGLRESEVRTWCRQHVAAWPNYRGEMTELMGGLAEAGFEVWLVSASNHWVIAAAAERYGIPRERALAIRTVVSGGRLTGRLVRPVPCEGGKVEAIEKWIGERPRLAVGDGMGDYAMLRRSAQGLVVGSRRKRGAPLIERAAAHGWPVHLFP